MVTVRMTDETYAILIRQLASNLDCQMLHGKVEDWDETNCSTLRALLELNIHFTYCGRG